jgi:cell division protein FtsL
MTPPASATTPHAARPTRRRPAQRPPRRVSGPATRRHRPATAGGSVAVAPPLALRLARAGGRIVDARFLDRLLRGRVWIALLALGLMGIVFIQVSMLRLNAGISRAITSAETLHHQNSTLRADISKLDSSERIADAAKTFGMVQPAAGSVRYLDARKASSAAAARGIHRPKAAKTATGTAATATTTAAVPTAAPATTATQAAAPPTATTQTTAPVQQQQQQPVQPQQVQPQQTQQQPVQQTQTQTQAPAAVTATGTGGQ